METFRGMRRKEKETGREEAFEILENADYLTLAVMLENSYPFSVPLNHILMNGKIYFHSAMEGQKTDAFKLNNRVCVSAVERYAVVPDKFYVNYRSVVAFGTISPVEDKKEKLDALSGIINRFSPGFEESGKAYIEKRFEHTAVYCIEIEHISGKKSRK